MFTTYSIRVFSNLFCRGSWFYCVICFYLRVPVSNTISLSNVYVVYHCDDRGHKKNRNCLPVRNTYVYHRCLVEFFMAIFVSTLCVSFELWSLISPFASSLFYCKLSIPPHTHQTKWRKQRNSNVLH